MYTQCPHCQTCFRIAEAHLKVAKGKVRCGSCQEIFDATQYLFKNLTDREPINDYKQPAATPAVSPHLPPQDTEHIDLFSPPTPPAKPAEEIRRERAKAPDQSHFMESVVGSDRYNDLDKLGPINIPGDLNFGDSFIKHAEEAESPPEPVKQQEAARTPYEDFEDKESPATTADHDSLKNFFAEVDAQLDEDDGKSQLDKDIDELLAFAKGLDLDADLDNPTKTQQAEPDARQTKPAEIEVEVEEEFDLQAIADFEKELDATSTGVFAAQQLQEDQSQFNDQPANESARAKKVKAPATQVATTESIADELPSIEEPAAEEAQPAKKKKAKQVTLDELPSLDEDIPRALRRSLDSLNQLPQRSLGQTLLMLLLILILIGGLGIQTVLFRNVELANMFPNLLPLLSKVCDQIPCRYSGKVDVSQIKLLNRDVRSDPNQPNALLISAAFVNQASFDQPYPILQITLYDLGGNVVASRRFTPQEYLGNIYNRFILMESGTPVHVTLAVLDPGKDAINFEFSFL